MITLQRVSWNRLESLSNYEEVPFEEINSAHIDKLISSTAQITEVHEPKTQIEHTKYMCSDCKTEVSLTEKQKNRCGWCNRKGTIVDFNNIYKDTQQLIISLPDTKKHLTLYLEDKLTSHDLYRTYDTISFKGVVRTVEKNNKNIQVVIQCKDIQVLSRLEEAKETKTTTDRNYSGYKEWVNYIQKRDKICQICGGNKHLEAHHIYSYKNNPTLRTDKGNGILLCTFCHNKFHSYYGKDVTPVDLVKFIQHFRGM